MNVPFLDLRAQHAPLKEEILAAWSNILDTCGFVNGPHVQGFESAFAKACDVGHAVTLSTGTDALILPLKALGVGPGDEVILPANTFFATAEGVSQVGGTPVFVDCLRDTWNIDPAAISAAVTPRTVGVIGVHLYGQPFDYDAVKAVADKHDLWVMEDSAQGHLATYKGRKCGSLGVGAGFSFYPGKNLGAPGEGGAFTTADEALAAKVRMLRDHGSSKKYHHELVGYNARLPAVMAAALEIKLAHLPRWTQARRHNAKRYLSNLESIANVSAPVEAQWAESAWHLFVVHVDDQSAVLTKLKEAGVGVGMHYPVPVHLQPAYESLGYKLGDFPNAEYNGAHCVSLPMFAELNDSQIDYVCEQLDRAVNG
ncbi:MAG TPA: erythromycin biosynthesis sensory transduction protein eryC1 [Myxococcales bacterium]|nr:erythromycin biosynthesis sensory transduction protein eryC1 [Myxococcales bacterium]HAN31358.1 erythromycin biosynthesis sensory transduction protein eryC1 [Myxococcales bacterium]